MNLESLFYERMGFSTVDLTDRYSFYLPFLSEADVVLDLGCGTGQFLHLLKKAGKRAVGVDLDPGMVALARRAGFPVVEQDILAFLESCDQRFGAVFCAHLVEHLPIDQVRRLLQLVEAVLEPSGRLVLVAPNPKSVYTQLYEFWRDPTHVRPYTGELLAFLVELAGFECVESGENPASQPYPPIPLHEWPIWTKRKPLARRILRRLLRYFLAEYADTVNALAQTQQMAIERMNVIFSPNEAYVVAKKRGEA